MVLCPLGDLLAEGSAESAQAEAAAVLSARQHSTLLQLRPRGVWAGGATACISTSQNPKLTPEGIWKETWRKTTPCQQDWKRQTAQSGNGSLKTASSLPSLLSAGVWETAAWETAVWPQ